MRTAVASTSLDAFHTFLTSGKLQAKETEIVRFLANRCHRDWTRNELALASGIRLSSVCGRCNRLVEMGVIEEGERRPDRHTGVAAHPLRLKALQAELFR